MSDAAPGDVDKGLTRGRGRWIEGGRRLRKGVGSADGWLRQGFVDRVSPPRIDWNCSPVPSGKRSMVNRLGMGIRQDFDRGLQGLKPFRYLRVRRG